MVHYLFKKKMKKSTIHSANAKGKQCARHCAGVRKVLGLVPCPLRPSDPVEKMEDVCVMPGSMGTVKTWNEGN
jgi:hypothetical protein